MTRSASPPSAQRFEVVDERSMPKRRKRGSSFGFTALLNAIRGVVEDGYVSIAGGVMGRAEALEDARAARGHASRARKAERRRLRQARAAAPPVAAERQGNAPPAPAS